MKSRISLILFILLVVPLSFQAQTDTKGLWISDNGDGTYKNPIIYADYSDPDVIRTGDDYFLISSSFQHTPGLPVLYSKDLVNWKIVNHIVQNIPYGDFKSPQHGNGIWAPSIRYHNGEYYVYFGDPDYGIFMSKTKNPFGKWENLTLVRKAKGWIDPCPLWDDDGQAYIVHAWANSRSGIKSRLTVNKLSRDGKKILDEGVTVFDGTQSHPTIEGPKFYKRNGYYYIFAPGGGVPEGWQVVLRSKNVYGPYDDKIVLEKGTTPTNGPHQGGWVETQKGESWFIHFQDKGAYGRVVHLEPVEWESDWPKIGVDLDSNGIGEPILTFRKPDVGKSYQVSIPQTCDEFTSKTLGLQWQWEANFSPKWFSLTAKKGFLRLYSPKSDSAGIWNMPNVVGQKFPAPEFTITTALEFNPASMGERAGLVVLGLDYSGLFIKKDSLGYIVSVSECINADKGGEENVTASKAFNTNKVFFRVNVAEGGLCTFMFSTDGRIYERIGKEFTARKGKWVGAKLALYSAAKPNAVKTGFTDFNFFRISSSEAEITSKEVSRRIKH